MAYIWDPDKKHVTSEGMSYGMVIAVQLDKKAEFDRLWRWAKAYMQNQSGPYRGYFAWECRADGTKLDQKPAPDGDQYLALSLFFAAGRWGNGTGINYQAEAQAILDTMLQSSNSAFNQGNHLVSFGTGATFTNPSYHLPAFYELWSRWADKNKSFWSAAAVGSRQFFKDTAGHSPYGLMPDYAAFNGSATDPWGECVNGQRNASGACVGGQLDPDYHKHFRFDAWRVASNVAFDYAWFAADAWALEEGNKLLEFFYSQGVNYPNQYRLDGAVCPPVVWTNSCTHSVGHVAMNAVAGLAATTGRASSFVNELWSIGEPGGRPFPQGQFRYYDAMLYMLGLLHVSGNFRIYAPPQ